jgi:hypothetical protein
VEPPHSSGPSHAILLPAEHDDWPTHENVVGMPGAEQHTWSSEHAVSPPQPKSYTPLPLPDPLPLPLPLPEPLPLPLPEPFVASVDALFEPPQAKRANTRHRKGRRITVREPSATRPWSSRSLAVSGWRPMHSMRTTRCTVQAGDS